MERLFGASHDQPYANRIRRLIERGIALWDVCASACREGSLDSEISAVIANNFSTFLGRHSHVRLICFNGTKADKIFRRRVLPNLAPNFAEIRREVLPSTSPAHAAMPLEEKLKRWREVLDLALRAKPALECGSSSYRLPPLSHTAIAKEREKR
jgi:hypoxanthine-DNA glycosylase